MLLRLLPFAGSPWMILAIVGVLFGAMAFGYKQGRDITDNRWKAQQAEVLQQKLEAERKLAEAEKRRDEALEKADALAVETAEKQAKIDEQAEELLRNAISEDQNDSTFSVSDDVDRLLRQSEQISDSGDAPGANGTDADARKP